MKYLIAVALVLILGLGGFFLWKSLSSGSDINKTSEKSSTSDTKEVKFLNPKKSAHYESNTPAHGEILAGTPIEVVINFNFDLANLSEIKIIKDNAEYGEGETSIDNNKLTMRRAVKNDLADGVYTVEYKACWPDGSCHDGSFQFAIDKDLSGLFEDQTTKNEVVVKLSSIQFMPQNLKISAGSTVKWINDEIVEHYVNTDSHPAHTYFLSQNSKLLKNGDEFEQVFSEPGIYPYHCSAHAQTMKGSVLVI